jgi:hypothetical protein
MGVDIDVWSVDEFDGYGYGYGYVEGGDFFECSGALVPATAYGQECWDIMREWL